MSTPIADPAAVAEHEPGALTHDFRGVPPASPTIAVATRLVTNRDFRKFLRSEPGWRPGAVSASDVDDGYLREWTEPRDAVSEHPDDELPVVNVSARAASAYADWASARLGQPARLLRSTEWETAAAAGRRNGWVQEELDADRVGCVDRSTEPTPVGSFGANLWGISDLLGNVYELCVDGDDVVARGGAWNSPCDDTLVRYPLKLTPRSCRFDVGFRVIVDLGKGELV